MHHIALTRESQKLANPYMEREAIVRVALWHIWLPHLVQVYHRRQKCDRLKARLVPIVKHGDRYVWSRSNTCMFGAMPLLPLCYDLNQNVSLVHPPTQI